MATTLTYTDAYLTGYIDQSVEDRARADVDDLGTFPTDWRDKLTVLRAYIITCLDKQAQPEDLFTAKLKSYRAEFDRQLAGARNAQAEVADTAPGLISIPILRG